MKFLNLPFIILIKLYKFFISPFFYGSCKFEVSCSTYALECFKRYNLIKAFMKTFLRIIKCNPWFSTNECSSHLKKGNN